MPQPQNNLPPNAGPALLEVEHRLPLPDADAATLVRLITDPLGPDESVASTVKRLQAQYGALTLPANVKRSVDTILEELSSLAHSKEPMAWILGRPHPLAGSKIVRMYLREDGGVDVYSSDGGMYVRTFIPARVVRFLDETMGEDTFVEFIEEEEEQGPEETDEPDEPEEPEPEEPGTEPAVAAPVPDAANGPSPST